MAEEEISFFANCKGWQCVKKRVIDAKTENPEVVAILSSIVTTAGRKAFDFSGVDIAGIKAYADQLTAGKRKSYNNVAEIFAALKATEVKEKLLPFCKEEKVFPLAEACFINAIFTNLQLYPWVDLEVLSKIYPEIKITKPRGRIAGAKKKQ